MQRKESLMSDHTTSAVEAASAAASSALKGATVGAGLAGTGAVLDSYTIGLIGLAVAVASFIVNWYYRHQEYVLKRSAHDRANGGDSS